jgi:hypothetical protein
LKVFDDKMLKIFGPKRDEMVGGWRKLHSEEPHNLCCSLNIIRMIKLRMRWVGHVVRICEKRNAYTILVGKPEGNRPLGRPRRSRENNIVACKAVAMQRS